MRLLILNANTSPGVTNLCADAARLVARPGTEIIGHTGRFGSRIIESRAENAIAVHALLEMLAEHHHSAEAAIIAVSYDTGLREARELVSIPVLGITQAALITASMLGERIGLVTFGTPDLYRELAASYGLGHRIAGIQVTTAQAAKAYAAPADILDEIVLAAEAVRSDAQADVVVLCGAALSGVAATISPRLSFPIVDGISCAVPFAEMLVGFPRKPMSGESAMKPTVNISPALANMLASARPK